MMRAAKRFLTRKVLPDSGKPTRNFDEAPETQRVEREGEKTGEDEEYAELDDADYNYDDDECTDEETFAICAMLWFWMAMVAILVVCLTYLSSEMKARNDPESFFETINNCLVLNVTKEFVVDGSDCFDVFSYEWTPKPGTEFSVVQSESIQRAAASCSDPGLITVENATLQIGQFKDCLILDDEEQGVEYIDAFNCAEPSPPCYSILKVTSTHEDPLAFGLSVSGLTLSVFMFCAWIYMLAYIEDE